MNMGKNRKGGLHTIEAIAAFIAVLGFIVFVMPGILDNGDVSEMRRNYVYESLHNLEKTGKLNELAAAENVSGIITELNKTMPAQIKLAAGLSVLNVTAGTIRPEESYEEAYINFSTNSGTLESATIELSYANATSPKIYINGNEAINHSGDYSGSTETIDISDDVVNGENYLTIKTQNNSTIEYRLRTTNSIEWGARPAKKTINTVNYIIAGEGSGSNTFKPVEIRIYVWK